MLPFLTSQLNKSQCCLSVLRVMACPSSTSRAQSLLPSHPPQAGIYAVGSPGFPEDPKQPGLCAVFAVSGRPLSPIWQLKHSSSGTPFEAGSCIPHLPAQSPAHSLLGAGRDCYLCHTPVAYFLLQADFLEERKCFIHFPLISTQISACHIVNSEYVFAE